VNDAVLPTLAISQSLPIAPLLDAIIETIRQHPVTIVCGATGSGKSTQIPQKCLSAMPDARIGHTQPRRLAARTVAARIAQETGEVLGTRIGFQTRFDQQLSPLTRLKVMTDGILLQEIARDPLLRAYDVLIVDEVHERSLNIDFLLGYLRRLLPRRSDLRVVLMSATVEAERFRAFFGTAGVVEIAGATHPVEVRYRPLEQSPEAGSALYEAIVEGIRELDRDAPGDVLVFLPGEREINEAAEVVTGAALPGTEVLPLYARLSIQAQQRVFAPHRLRHIVLSTNVAETSVTVPGVRHVIDSGLARIGSYSPRSKLQRLPISVISQASAAQRQGRCGRERAGICIRLYSEAQLARSPAYTQPELLRSNLAGVILRLADLQIGRLEDFPLLDAPRGTAINDGYQLLRELGALDADRRLLRLGRRLARLPVDPRLARMLVAAGEYGCLTEALVIVSALSDGDIRERPVDERQAADIAHQRYRDYRSDFLWYLGAWKALQTELLPLSRRQQQAYCAAAFWSYRRVREWIDIHRELGARARAMSLRCNAEPASYRAIHQALLAGVVTRVARWERKSDYLGCRQQRLRLHPASALRMKPPHWIMAAEITETTLTYARMAAKVDPKWIALAAAALVRKTYSVPVWDVTRGEVYVLEEQALYGLTLISGRRIPLQQLDAPLARELFIRHALIAGELGSQAEFLTHNLDLVKRVQAAEERARRRDLLAEETALVAFYTACLPPEIVTRRQLLAWMRAAPTHADRLRMDESVVTRPGIARIRDYLYPDRLLLGGMSFPLSYRYAPGEQDDGITIDVPLAALTRMRASELDRLVPGLLAEKIAVLIKRLPKGYRRYLSPLAEFSQALTAAIESIPGSLCGALGVAVKRMTGLCIADNEWNTQDLPAHLRMRVRLLDAESLEVDTTRDLAGWVEARHRDIAESFAALPWGFSAAVMHDWRCEPLSHVVERDVGGVTITGYPALRDCGEGVQPTVLAAPREAEHAHRGGIIRLLTLALAREIKALRKSNARTQALELQALRLDIAGGIGDDLLRATLESILDTAPLPRDREAFEGLLASAAADLLSAYKGQCERLQDLFARALHVVHHEVPRVAPRWPEVAAEVRRQLQALFVPGFLWRRRDELVHYPRYLQAISVRVERLQENPAKDAQRRAVYDALNARCARELGRLTTVQRQRLQFLMTEYQVALFAPTLRTAEKISPQRIEEFLDGLDSVASA